MIVLELVPGLSNGKKNFANNKYPKKFIVGPPFETSLVG
jgi:hypothetical protein